MSCFVSNLFNSNCRSNCPNQRKRRRFCPRAFVSDTCNLCRLMKSRRSISLVHANLLRVNPRCGFFSLSFSSSPSLPCQLRSHTLTAVHVFMLHAQAKYAVADPSKLVSDSWPAIVAALRRDRPRAIKRKQLIDQLGIESQMDYKPSEQDDQTWKWMVGDAKDHEAPAGQEQILMYKDPLIWYFGFRGTRCLSALCSCLNQHLGNQPAQSDVVRFFFMSDRVVVNLRFVLFCMMLIFVSMCTEWCASRQSAWNAGGEKTIA